MQNNFTTFDIHGKGVPEIHHYKELETFLKSLACKKVYDSQKKTIRTSDKPNSLSPKACNSSHVTLSDNYKFDLIRVLKKCFPSLMFRLSGNFIYGPGDAIGEHTNSDDPSDTFYITYATGESSFSYRFSLDDDFIETPDMINGLTLRAFEITSKEPYTFHKVDCKSGYRVSIGLRYIDNDN